MAESRVGSAHGNANIRDPIVAKTKGAPKGWKDGSKNH